jgi:hypothetical protein
LFRLLCSVVLFFAVLVVAGCVAVLFIVHSLR